jgi:glycosyltransferase involved in cell wall biosynthesis
VNWGYFGFWIQRISFLFFAKLYLCKAKNVILYTRDDFSGFFFKDHFVELHSLPKTKNFLFKKFLKRARGFFVLTNFIKEELEKNFGINSEKILISPDAVDLAKFDIKVEKQKARELLNLPLDKKILGYTGSFKTMGKDKGISDIIKAIKILSNDNDDFLFIAIGGNNNDIDYYKKKAKKERISQYVKFISRVDLNNLAIYQKACDILLMPYPNKKHYSFYMSALKMFEYMASKRPIIASCLPSIKEILNKENSFFCNPDDPEDLVERIKYVFDNYELAEKIALKAFEDVKDYTWRKRAEKIVSFFNN